MHYRAFDISLLISIIFHILVGVIFFFIIFPHRPPLFKVIEISVIKLPEKEEPKVLKSEPKVKKERIIRAIKNRLMLNVEKTTEPIKKPILPVRHRVTQRVEEIITPTPIPHVPEGVKKDKSQGEIPVPEGVINEKISQDEKEEKISQISPNSNVETKDDKEENIGPYIYISGPASKRKALYQPKFKPPYWLEKMGQSVQGKLKIWVLPDGSVDKVEIEESFGYAEIDRLAQLTVYKWRFYKLPPDVTRLDWGIVAIVIQLK